MSRRDELKLIAEETIKILKNGNYEIDNQRLDIKEKQLNSEQNSVLISPQEGKKIINKWTTPVLKDNKKIQLIIKNEATVKSILDISKKGINNIGVLSFASAKNPGGGFLKGSMAQEESIAISSNLYNCLLKHPKFYEENKFCKSMTYTDYAIYSPDVVFFRDEKFKLIRKPLTASVLTLPAVNYGQVVEKGEHRGRAKEVMKNRMRLSLAIFAEKGAKVLILGAYGCGVFKNNPVDIARWWHELLFDEGYGELFESVYFSILDRTGGQVFSTFERILGGNMYK